MDGTMRPVNGAKRQMEGVQSDQWRRLLRVKDQSMGNLMQSIFGTHPNG
jgi:hypothetical protein